MRKRLSKDRKFAGMLRENALIEELNSAESAAPFSSRGCRVPSKALFTAKHLTVFGLFRIALSKRRGEKKEGKGKKGKREKKKGENNLLVASHFVCEPPTSFC